MGTIIAVANQKGGVGKTTTAVNLSASIAIAEKKTLLVDMDPQCNATSGVGVSYNKVISSIYDVLIGKKSMEEIVLKTQVPYLDLAPSHPDLIGVEVELLDVQEREMVLKKALAGFKDRQSHIIIDVTVRVLCARRACASPQNNHYHQKAGEPGT